MQITAKNRKEEEFKHNFKVSTFVLSWQDEFNATLL